MRILTSEQIRSCDANTIAQGISSIQLMEKAGAAVANSILEYLNYKEFRIDHFIDEEQNFTIYLYCGPGNNGGDGYVIARRLKNEKYSVKVIRVGGEPQSADCKINHDLFVSSGGIVEKFNSSFISEKSSIIVDAILGSGINRKVENEYLEAVRQINNNKKAVVFSVDMPSGMFSEQEMPSDAEAVFADVLYKFHAPVLNMVLPQYLKYFNESRILDIGLVEPPEVESVYFITGSDYFIQSFLHRPRAAHKGVFGHSCIIAGSLQKGGAAILAGKACLRTGTGLLTMCIPGALLLSMHTVLPEAMVQLSDHEHIVSGKFDYSGFTAIGFGPGIGVSAETTSVLKYIIQDIHIPLVIDADGLNILAENLTWLAFLKPNTILTPHPGEFARLSGEKRVGLPQIHKASEMALRFGIVIVLKGAYTAVCLPNGSIYFNPTGNSGMARGGSGDVLTGIITSLLAQGYHPFDAARLGVFIHGMAGDFAARQFTGFAMRISDLSDSIVDVFNLYFLHEERDTMRKIGC